MMPENIFIRAKESRLETTALGYSTEIRRIECRGRTSTHHPCYMSFKLTQRNMEVLHTGKGQ